MASLAHDTGAIWFPAKTELKDLRLPSVVVGHDLPFVFSLDGERTERRIVGGFEDSCGLSARLLTPVVNNRPTPT
ncbi:hypothetical protein BDM02DRAFT_3122835 [Thelephora ganbajun]|uniref:Uncharacterized protein n=1 Tax=Thelephora ganbajun TaxID=370292 RepID=A0ACB6Z303_THEGA|nr:hypothetical protein BDM02DRAFT_3122835 [Thelephora ganbajun]